MALSGKVGGCEKLASPSGGRMNSSGLGAGLGGRSVVQQPANASSAAPARLSPFHVARMDRLPLANRLPVEGRNIAATDVGSSAIRLLFRTSAGVPPDFGI